MKIIYLGIIALIFLIGIVSAEESISQTSFIIKIYNNTISIVSNEYSGNNQFFEFEISESNESNVTRFYVPYKEFNYSFLFVKNASIDINLVQKYIDCLNTNFSMTLDLTKNLTQCEDNLRIKDTNITNKQEQINKLTTEAQNTQNQKYLFGVGGAVLAILGLLFYQGKIGRKVKSKSEEFGRTQAA